MGDWTYYTTVMSAADLVLYVKFAEEVCPNQDLDNMIQREVSNRAKDIADYLKSNDQRFFGSLIVAAYDGKPRFRSIRLTDSSLLDELEDRVGVLQFDGSEQYYALDGQHRLAAYRLEVARDPKRYESDNVSMIVICHTKDEDGMSRARRLFTTVNRYAKKTSAATHTAMSEDDGVAIITRRLIRTHPLFKRRIKVLVVGRNGKPKLATGNAMSASDREYLMAIETFRKCNQFLLPDHLKVAFAREQQAPSFESLEEAFSAISASWDKMIGAIAPWQTLLDPNADLSAFRNASDEHILARPIGITAFVAAFATAPTSMDAEHIKRVVSDFQSLNSSPWSGLLWNSVTKKMVVTVEAEKLARRLWRYLLGLDEDKDSLERDWIAIVEPGSADSHRSLPGVPQ